MELKLDDGLRELIELGKRQSYLTYDQLNALIPLDTTDPERLAEIQERLENEGILAGMPPTLGRLNFPSTTTDRALFVKLSYLFRF